MGISGLLLRFVTSGRLAVFGQVAGGPQQAAGDQVEVARVGDGGVVVANRRGEDLRLAVVGVGPGDDVIVDLFFPVPRLGDLFATGQGLCCVKQLAVVEVVIQFLA